MTRSHRDEFPRAVRREVFARAFDPHSDIQACRCENPHCNAVLKKGEGEIDHMLPVALGGKPVIENARLLCTVCHKAKSASDIVRVRKADRQRDKATGAIRPAAAIRSAPFPRSPKTVSREQRNRDRAELQSLAAKIQPAWERRP